MEYRKLPHGNEQIDVLGLGMWALTIDIGLVNKYYDLALAGDDIAANHYTKQSTLRI